MTNLQNKKIVVFGGSGFIGRYVVKRLAKMGARIDVPTRNVEKAKFLRPYGDVGQINPIPCELTDQGDLRRAINGADAVICLLGILYESGKSKFDVIHREIPAQIAAIAKECGVESLVHVSAIGAEQNSPAKYAQSKFNGERAVLNSFPPATILRPSIVFGPEDGFFNLFASLARFLPALPLIGGGKTKFQPVYVGDVADAIIATIGNPRAKAKIYELGGPQIYSFAELMRIMLSYTGQKACLISVPFWSAKIKAGFLQLLPKPLLTVDQVKMLEQDNVTSGMAMGLADLGVAPHTLDVILPTYLDQYKPGGRLNNAAKAA